MCNCKTHGLAVHVLLTLTWLYVTEPKNARNFHVINNWGSNWNFL